MRAVQTTGEITEALLESYRRLGGINHLEGPNLPSKASICRLTQDLLHLVFPGFFNERITSETQLREDIEELICSVKVRLEREIAKSLIYHLPAELNGEEPTDYACAITTRFFQRLPGIREVLQTDAEAAYNGDPAALSLEEVIVAYPFMESIAVQRMAHELYLGHVPLVPRIMTEWSHSRTGMDLHPGARIGPYFFIDHGTGTVLGETCEIGERVKMYHNVGLVARSLAAGQGLRGIKRHPTVHDRVTIYAGATIVGGDTEVGANSVIGGNVFLMESVPSDSIVLYNDGKMLIQPRKSSKKPIVDAEPIDYQI